MSVRFDSSLDEYQQTSLGLGTGDFTICLWAKIVTDRNNYSTIVCVDNGTINQLVALQTDVDGTTPYMWVSPGGNSSGFAATVGTWYRLAVRRSGSTVDLFYGPAGGSVSSVTGATLSGTMTASTFRLGDSAQTAEWFNGEIANVKVYNTALTQNQIVTEWGNWQAQRTTNLVAHYKFQSGASTTDNSGNGKTLTVISTPVNGASNPSINDSAPTLAPIVDGGADTTIALGSTLSRTASEDNNGLTITSRSWTIQAGPSGVGNTIGTAAALSWTPGTAGTYTIRYSATNSAGTSTDDVDVTVVDTSAYPVVLQSKIPGTTTPPTHAVTLDAAATAGNLLVYALGVDKNGNTLTLTDNIGTNGGANPWNIVVSKSGASTSLYVAWKVAVGGETTITGTTSATPSAGCRVLAAELVQDGSGAWGVVASSNPAYSDALVSSVSTGTTGAATYNRLALAFASIDTVGNATSAHAWSNSYTFLYDDTNTSGAAAGLWVGQKNLDSGLTTSSTFSYTGTTDQMTAALVAFGRAVVATDTTRFFLAAA